MSEVEDSARLSGLPRASEWLLPGVGWLVVVDDGAAEEALSREALPVAPASLPTDRRHPEARSIE